MMNDERNHMLGIIEAFWDSLVMSYGCPELSKGALELFGEREVWCYCRGWKGCTKTAIFGVLGMIMM
mgnify:CR=1 FL=1